MDVASQIATTANPPPGGNAGPPVGTGTGIGPVLERAARALSKVPGARASAERLDGLAERMAAQRMQVAVLGQFKRGKSTFLNAILGADLLPMAVVPLTAVPIFVEYGAAPAVRIHYLDDRPPDDFTAEQGDDLRGRLYAAAAEEANPENRLGVDHVQVFFPAAALADGTVLIDTPGIGSTHRHNTEAARHILPECDAGLVVLSADPPITEAELAYLADVRRNVPRLFFVLNKVDYLSADERAEETAFLKRVLGTALGDDAPASIHGVSARRALAARLADDARGVAESGLAAIEDDILRVLAAEKTELLGRAIARKAKAVLATGRGELAVAAATLRMPVDQLERAGAEFEALLPAFERQRREAQDLLAGDRRRMLAEMEENAVAFRDRASTHIDETIGAVLADAGHALPAPSLHDLEAAARDAVAQAIPAFFEAERNRLAEMFTDRVAEVFRPHRQRAAELIGAVRKAAAELFNLPLPALEEAEGFEFVRQPYWTVRDYVGLDMVSSIGQAVGTSLGWLQSRTAKTARLHRHLHDDAMTLIRQNVESLRWSTLQSLESAVHKFSHDFDSQLAQAIEATQGAIRTALDQRRRESGRIADEVSRLEALDAELAGIEQRLGTLPTEPPSRDAGHAG